MKLVSIIVPVYNTEQYLGRCVDSLRAQSYENLEIILVDDASPDGCPEMCDEYAREDSRIKVVHQENAGLGGARNGGLAVARGDYVTFVDSDDWIEREHIERLEREMTETGADLVIGTLKSVNGEGEESRHKSYVEKKIYEGDALRECLLYPMIGAAPDFGDDVQIDSSCCTNLYSMALIREHGLYYPSEREAVAEDVFFNIEYLRRAERVSVMDESGYCYYQNGMSISRKYDRRRFERTLEYYRRLSAIAEECGGEEMRIRACRSFLMKIRVAIRLAACSDMKYKEKMAVIREMLGHPTVHEALCTYPIEKYGRALRVLSRCMRSGRARSVYLLTRIREFARDRRALKGALRSLGLGR